MGEQPEQVEKSMEAMELDSGTVASSNRSITHNSILSNEAHLDLSPHVQIRQPSHHPVKPSQQTLTNEACSVDYPFARTSQPSRKMLIDKARPDDYPFLRTLQSSRKIPTNKTRSDDYPFLRTVQPSRQFEPHSRSLQQYFDTNRVSSVLPTRTSYQIEQPMTSKKDDAYWMAKRATLRIELEEAETECRKRGLVDEDRLWKSRDTRVSMKRGPDEDNQEMSQTSKKVKWSSNDIIPSSSGSNVQLLKTPQKLRWLAPQTTALTSNPKFNLAEQPVLMDPSAPSSNVIRKPYSASPLPEWLQAEIRTTVCGICSPSKLPAGTDPKEAWSNKSVVMPYSCIICDKPDKAIGHLKSHFYHCVQKNGNPNAYNWFDSPTILNEWQRRLGKREGRPWKTQSKPWKIEMGHRTNKKKPKKAEGGAGGVTVQGGKVSKGVEEEEEDVEGMEGVEGAEGEVQEEDEDIRGAQQAQPSNL